MYKLAVVSTHPIQYHTPWYQALSDHPEIDLTVCYCHDATPGEQAAAGFGVDFEWDVPLLKGYNYAFLKNVARKPSISGFFGMDVPEIAARIREDQFDAVLVSGWTYKAAWQAFFACWRDDIPLMVRGDSHLHTQRSLLKRVMKYPFYRWFLSRMDAGLAVGQWSRDYFLHYGVPEDRVFIVPHVIDEQRFLGDAVQMAEKRGELRRAWNIPVNAVVFMFCGKLNAQKRPLDFVAAVKSASARNPLIFGLVVGDGPLRQDCEALADELNAPIRFTGFLNQSSLPAAYSAVDVIVLPSNSNETWGLVINEAMLSGLPALVSDQVGCGPDLIVSGQTGDIFPMGDVEKLSALMIEYAADPVRLESMRSKSRERILAGYSTEQAVNGVLSALKRVVR